MIVPFDKQLAILDRFASVLDFENQELRKVIDEINADNVNRGRSGINDVNWRKTLMTTRSTRATMGSMIAHHTPIVQEGLFHLNFLQSLSGWTMEQFNLYVKTVGKVFGSFENTDWNMLCSKCNKEFYAQFGIDIAA